MSDYVRKKAIRYKISQDLVKEIEDKIDKEDLSETPEEILSQQYGLEYSYNHNKGTLEINSGYNYDKDESDLFLDFLVDYEYGANGDFAEVRLLTNKEFEKYKKIFQKYFKIKNRNDIRLVHYCYYNGVDEPSVWEFEEV